MTESKMRKTITAIASAATLLLVILLSVLIYQWITISVQEKRIAAAQDRVDYWTQANEEAEDDLDYYLTDAYKTWEAIKKGYTPSQNGD
ncbi:MAG: hypothetical protein IJ329_04170 [Clostridia bacterium]|nr:hypothetical protein [Clostridia bacterium]